MNKKTKLLFFLTLIILVVNIFFMAGWNTWTITLTQLVSCLILAVALIPEISLSRLSFNPSVILLAAGLIVSLLFSRTYVASISAFYLYISYFFIFIAASSFFQTPTEKLYVKNSLLFFGTTAVIFDILLFSLYKIRLFPNENIKAGFLLMIFPFLLEELLAVLSKKRILNSLLFFIFFLIFLISFINAASVLAAVILIFSIFAYLHFTEKLKLRTGIAAAILTAAAVFLITLKQDAISQRLVWLEAGIKMFLSRPFTGFGINSASHILPAFLESERLTLYLHSFFLQFLSENGIIAFAGLLWLLIVILKRTFTEDKTAFTAVLAVIVYNFFEYNLSIPAISVTFILIAGSFSRTEKLHISIKSIKGAAATVILLFLLAVFARYSVNPFLAERHFAKGSYELKTGNYNEAEKQFNQALEIYRDYPLAQLGLAIINLRKNNFETAAAFIKDSLVINRGPAYNSFIQGMEYLSQGEKARALNHFIITMRYRLIQHGFDPKNYLLTG